ncbi:MULTISPECIES: hypothetical protein [Pseudomonas]|uniref:Uncharacterized protein n=2 Tax=Pseudomonadaceae TaxID=135621 RepID=A0A0D0L921_9PSED|nr:MULTISPECIES: hypothetical protein [Pseudomonas]KIQ06508.1 hypothetical protein RU08_00135 [Pseudomonas fulva]MCW2291222.1 hypothetical protein [Pseudomonas sp. BIGb0408]NYH74207.1 hypothetical protein [Pseudomonas flavescens]
MKVINLKDGTAHYQGNPGYAAPKAFADGSRQQWQLQAVGQTHMQMQRPGEELGDEEDEELDPGTGTESEPTSLPDEAPAVEPEDFDGNRSELDIKRAQASSRPM